MKQRGRGGCQIQKRGEFFSHTKGEEVTYFLEEGLKFVIRTSLRVGLNKITAKESSWGYEVKNGKKTSQKNDHTLFNKNLGHFYQKYQYLDLAFFCLMSEVRTSHGILLTLHEVLNAV